ncbi:FABP family protein [Planomonospora sp. ID67723]|uniref:FABP family protein n=1 Tax=Planomonospora sp. ID67723 TaxID=2738134 RepID=UPI0018C3A6BB|nr:FABP family protein [Planomonospora sp. ID67723]MBG0827585.1 FABP family protein [Planomonospora sp. ID67723]
MDVPELHADLEPIAFLVGRWEGAGVGGYPTIESFNFGQEIVFGHNGKPFLTYTSRTWLLDEAGNRVRPLGTETGFWRQLPGRQLEVCLSHPTGIVEIYVGEVVFHKIELHTDVVARTATAKEYTGGHRLYGLVNGNLMWAYDMAAMGQRLQSHISAELKRVGDFVPDVV